VGKGETSLTLRHLFRVTMYPHPRGCSFQDVNALREIINPECEHIDWVRRDDWIWRNYILNEINAAQEIGHLCFQRRNTDRDTAFTRMGGLYPSWAVKNDPARNPSKTAPARDSRFNIGLLLRLVG
ncbi:MAG: hypothetical protein O7E57_03720, partial [Gammaproteobacteria bacterium]|nr:hypothetical protein [Gammaproteobacteria bacterium]